METENSRTLSSSFEELFIRNIITEEEYKYNMMQHLEDTEDDEDTYIYKVHWNKDDNELCYLTAKETHWAFKYDVSVSYVKVSKSSPEYSLAFYLSKKKELDNVKKQEKENPPVIKLRSYRFL